MKVLGDNSRFGSERVALTDRRIVMPVEVEDDPFPQGTGGLIPVITLNRRGEEREVFAFPLGGSSDLSAESEAGDAEGPDPVAASIRTLEAAVDAVNDVMAQASDLIGEDLGYIAGINVEIAEEGEGFTRVEFEDVEAGQTQGELADNADNAVDADAANAADAESVLDRQLALPLARLVLETSDEPGSDQSATCMVAYNKQGRPERVTVSLYEEEGMGLRIGASWRHDLHGFLVMWVEELNGRLIYKHRVPRKKRRKS